MRISEWWNIKLAKIEGIYTARWGRGYTPIREEDIENIKITPLFIGKKEAHVNFTLKGGNYYYWIIWRRDDGLLFLNSPRKQTVAGREGYWMAYQRFPAHDYMVIEKVILRKWLSERDQYEEAKNIRMQVKIAEQYMND